MAQPPECTRLLFLAILVVSVGFRTTLTLFNTGANDDHMQVVNRIITEHRLPSGSECWECYQPKLFHVVTAGLLHALPAPANAIAQIRAAQALAHIAGLLTIYIVYRFISIQNWPPPVKLLSFALAALNPKAIAISAQATNDSLVIFFSTLGTYAIYRYYGDRRPSLFVIATLGTICGVLSKGNGLVTFVAITCTLVISMFLERRVHLRSWARPAAMIVGVLASAWVLGPYADHYRRHGTPFYVNVPPKPSPRWFTKTPTFEPGILSIADGYFTFRFLDLLQHPYERTATQTGDSPDLPGHRTSLWSQLYARAHFLHFDTWPPSLTSWSPTLTFVGRMVFVAALLPTFILCLGIFCSAGRLLVTYGIRRRKTDDAWNRDVLLMLLLVGYLGFIVTYSYRFRWMPSMKVIFIYPAVLAFVYFFGIGLEWVMKRLSARRTMTHVVVLWHVVLAGLYCWELWLTASDVVRVSPAFW